MLQSQLRTSVPGALGALALCAAAIALPLALRAEAATPGCGGRSATIVSNDARIVGTRGPHSIRAGPGVNEIFGRNGNDTICGGGNDDRIHGGRGSDRLDGGAGRDLVDGDTGNERLSGGPGAHDIAVYRDAGGPLEIHLGAGRVSGAEQEPLRRIDDAIGGPGDDAIFGSRAHGNRLDGGPGDDLLYGAGPGDHAFGGPGDNRCEGRLELRISCGNGNGGDRTAVALYRGIGDRTSLTIAGSDDSNDVTVEGVGGTLVVRSNGGVGVQLGDSDSASCQRADGGDSVSCRGAVTSIVAALGGGDDHEIGPDPDTEAGHPGTNDLDVGLAIALLDDEQYAEIGERLRQEGFGPDENSRGNPTPQRWKLGSLNITIDFLLPPIPGAEEGGRMQPLEGDLSAMITPGLQLAQDERQEVVVDGHTLKGEQVRRSIPVCGPATFVVLKALAFHDRGEPKDAFDLVYVLRRWPGGISDIVERLGSHAETDPEILDEALDKLSSDFSSSESHGPLRAAEFGGDAGGDVDAGAADAHGYVDDLLRQCRAAVRR